ncbi:MAG: hypothetical protein AAF585_17690 [Verrucomicrobiota bacterium]
MFSISLAVVFSAKAPLSREKLQKESKFVFFGEVIDISSKDQKSEIETGPGIHRDRVYSIRIKITAVEKGADPSLNAEKIVIVQAWKPSKRIPPEPGLQGHKTIPKKGDNVRIFVEEAKNSVFHPILPNGIQIIE